MELFHTMMIIFAILFFTPIIIWLVVRLITVAILLSIAEHKQKQMKEYQDEFQGQISKKEDQDKRS